MNSLFSRFCHDECGFVVSSELVLVSSIAVTGMIVGLVEVRDSMTAELDDLSDSIGSINQSYSFGGLTGCRAITSGSCFTDVDDTSEQVDFCQVDWEHESQNPGPAGRMGIIEIDPGSTSDEIAPQTLQQDPDVSPGTASETNWNQEGVI